MACNTAVTNVVYNVITKIAGGATMIRKSFLALLIISLLVMGSALVFANDDETEDYVHIISPIVGESGKTLLNDSLFISIYIETDDTLFLSMKKVMPTFTFEEVNDKEIITYVELEPAEPVDENVDGEKIPLGEVDAVAPLTKDEIVAGYQIAEEDFKILEKEYDEAKKIVSEVPSLLDESSVDYDPTYKLTEEEVRAINYLEDVTVRYKETLAAFEAWKKKYDQLFEDDVFEQQEIVVDAQFPYYEYTVSDIEPGNYKLMVTNLDGQVIEVLEFEIVPEKVIADTIIEGSNIFEKIIDKDVFE